MPQDRRHVHVSVQSTASNTGAPFRGEATVQIPDALPKLMQESDGGQTKACRVSTLIFVRVEKFRYD